MVNSAGTHNHPQPPTITHNYPEISHNHPQLATTTHNQPQSPTISHNYPEQSILNVIRPSTLLIMPPVTFFRQIWSQNEPTKNQLLQYNTTILYIYKTETQDVEENISLLISHGTFKIIVLRKTILRKFSNIIVVRPKNLNFK